jgi:glycosyltransferase involved in cell wall biosynthesis
MTLHLVYPSNPFRIAAPWSIGNNLSDGLWEAGYDVELHDWEETHTIEPVEGDILLGHPHPVAGKVFCNSLAGPWAKKVVMTPINIQEENREFALAVIAECDHFIAISGPRWSWLPGDAGIEHKTTLVDLAVDPDDFPFRKTGFGPPGYRRFLYIGCVVPFKNPTMLTALARATQYDFYHLGFGDIIDIKNLGYAPLEDPRVQEAVSHFDFLITPSVFDANPTTVLECGMLGLVAACSPNCGWDVDVTGIFPFDLEKAVECMRSLQWAGEDDLMQRAADVRDTIEEKYTWGRFVETVCAVLS